MADLEQLLAKPSAVWQALDVALEYMYAFDFEREWRRQKAKRTGRAEAPYDPEWLRSQVVQWREHSPERSDTDIAKSLAKHCSGPPRQLKSGRLESAEEAADRRSKLGGRRYKQILVLMTRHGLRRPAQKNSGS
jgi:hypothetical protein